MKMFRLWWLAAITSVLFAQNPADLFNKPPADVDLALRTRITEFFNYHVKQQFRAAEALVAEDTKEFFYTHNKPQYLSFEIRRIEYSDNFTRAKATVVCEQYVMMPGFGDKPVQFPIPSRWKLVDGKWFWYVDQEETRESPFGKMTAGPGQPGRLTPLPSPADSIQGVLGKVKADKPTLALRPGEEAQVKLTNSAPGFMSIKVDEVTGGLQATLDKAQLNRDETAVLTVRAGKDAKSGTVSVLVDPTRELVNIQVTVK
jgi:hypothetical protein